VAQLSISRNGRLEGVFQLPDRPVVLGRADGVDIQLLDSRVSRRHAVIRQSVAGFMIQDFTTKNGTFVNKEPVEKSLLFHGDTVVIGGYTIHFLEEDTVEDLDTAQISMLDATGESGSLRVPAGLRGGNPRSATNVDAGSPSPGARANRMDRVRARDLLSISANVPLIEGLAPADSAERSRGDGGASVEFSLSDIEIVIDDER
jgi:pSer/pThr/pTyr-binding forkhead associated (FHA) protein